MLARLRKPTLEENEGGFTLIELLVVMVIIGILAAIAIPAFLSQKTKAYESSMKSDLRSIATEIETQLVDAPTSIAIGGGASDGAAVTITPVPAAATVPTINISGNNKLSSTATVGPPMKNWVITTGANAGTYCVDLVNSKSNTVFSLKKATPTSSQVLAVGACS